MGDIFGSTATLVLGLFWIVLGLIPLLLLLSVAFNLSRLVRLTQEQNRLLQALTLPEARRATG